MKLLPTGWPNGDVAKAIGFFAQASLELVHEKSWESYKLPTLSPLWRLIEARGVSQSVMRGILPQKALDPIVDEANESFTADPAIRSILLRRQIEATDLTVSRSDKPHDIYTQCGFLIDFCHNEYRQEVENLLIEECFSKKRRSEIYALLKNYFSNIVLNGQSRQSIEMGLRDHFFTKTFTVDRSLLRRFFSRFPKKDQTFNIYGVAAVDLVEAMSRVVQVRTISGSKIPRKLNKIKKAGKHETYFLIDAQARDHYAAAIISGSLLGAAEAILSLFPGESMGELPATLNVTKRKASVYLSAPSKIGYSKRILSHSTNSAFRHMDRFANLLVKSQNSDAEVGANLFRATMTAALAEKSTAAEVKLLTLWAAFEALLPIVPDGAGNRISHFLRYIVPAVTISYARDSFLEFSRDADRLHHTGYRDYLNAIPGDGTPVDKLAALVINGSPEQKRGFCAIFLRNPLALYRLRVLENSYSDPSKFENTIKRHSQRVSWQIQRIYRERNTVMHSGQSSRYIDQLLSNTYHYYGMVFVNIETVSKSYGGLSTSHALSAIRKLNQADEAKLIRAKTNFSDDPIRSQATMLEIVAGHFRVEAD